MKRDLSSFYILSVAIAMHTICSRFSVFPRGGVPIRYNMLVRVALRPISAHRLKAPSTRINGALEPGVAIPRHYLPLIGAVRGCDSL
jgi:hypothetical protein